MTWRYHAFTAAGDGRTVLAASNLDLSSPAVVRDLSGPGSVSGTITPEIARYKDSSGRPIFLPYRTILVAEYAGRITAGVLEGMDIEGPNLRLEAPGLISGLLRGTAHTGVFSGVKVDPLDVVREQIIGHAQSQPGGDLGITVDPLRTRVRIGEELREVEFSTGAGQDVAFEAGPYVLAWYKTDDLGKELDDLAVETPFDYLLETRWKTATELTHNLRLGHPRIGSRRNELRFMVGENIVDEPTQTFAGEEYASEVLVLGAGEGRDMIRGTARKSGGRLRRVRTITDKSITSRARADRVAADELKRGLGEADITQVTVAEHPNAPLTAFDVGDEINLQWPSGWTPRGDLWVRVLSIEYQPDLDQAVLSVARVEKI